MTTRARIKTHRRRSHRPRPWLLLARRGGGWTIAGRWRAYLVAYFAGLALVDRGRADEIAVRRSTINDPPTRPGDR